MNRITPHGKFAHASLNSIRAAEALQGLAVARINEDFAAEKSEELNIDNLTWERFVRELEDADANDEMDQLNRRILQNILLPIVQQIMQPAPEGANQ